MKSARHNGLLYLVLLLVLLYWSVSCSKKVNHQKPKYSYGNPATF